MTLDPWCISIMTLHRNDAKCCACARNDRSAWPLAEIRILATSKQLHELHHMNLMETSSSKASIVRPLAEKSDITRTTGKSRSVHTLHLQ